MQNFNAVPQRKAKTYDPSWTRNLLIKGRTASPAAVAQNRAKIAALETAVRAGKVSPIYLGLGERL